MSSHYWVEHAFGMFLTMEEANVMATELANKLNDNACINLLFDKFGASIIDDNNKRDNKIGHYDGRVIHYLDADIHEEMLEGVFLYGSKPFGTAFVTDKNKCYKDIDDMTEDFKIRYGEYLPKNFNYKSHLVEFFGTVFG